MAEAHEIREKHWAAKKWAGMIACVVREVFSTVEEDEDEASDQHFASNPRRLNTQKRIRWLCERTMVTQQSSCKVDKLHAKVDGMERKVDGIERKVDELRDDMARNTHAILTRLHEVATH